MRETVLYYTPDKSPKVRKVKSVLIRLGLRIKNVEAEQLFERVGVLAGMEAVTLEPVEDKRTEAVTEEAVEARRTEAVAVEAAADTQAVRPGDAVAVTMEKIPEEMLVLCGISENTLDRLLRELRKANARVDLKAVLTQTNATWSFYELYGELCRERAEFQARGITR